jgi:gamma-glutamyltranspeptidase
VVVIEDEAPDGWEAVLGARGHEVRHGAAVGGRFGHAHVIERGDGAWIGAADPRAIIGAAGGW